MLARIWRGELPLATVFWLFGVLLSPVFFWITFKLGGALPETWAMFGVLGIWLLYAAFVSISIWRSSSRYSGSKALKILARISICIVWIASLVIGISVFYFMGLDPFTTSRTVEAKITPDNSLPFIGFWKTDCSEDFGLAIEKASIDEYYVRFCGPGGCFGKTNLMRTKLAGDARYKIIDNNTIGVNTSAAPQADLKTEEANYLEAKIKDGFLIFKRCK